MLEGRWRHGRSPDKGVEEVVSFGESGKFCRGVGEEILRKGLMGLDSPSLTNWGPIDVQKFSSGLPRFGVRSTKLSCYGVNQGYCWATLFTIIRANCLSLDLDGPTPTPPLPFLRTGVRTQNKVTRRVGGQGRDS